MVSKLLPGYKIEKNRDCLGAFERQGPEPDSTLGNFSSQFLPCFCWIFSFLGSNSSMGTGVAVIDKAFGFLVRGDEKTIRYGQA